jgi:hypothetical protein
LHRWRRTEASRDKRNRRGELARKSTLAAKAPSFPAT